MWCPWMSGHCTVDVYIVFFVLLILSGLTWLKSHLVQQNVNGHLNWMNHSMLEQTHHIVIRSINQSINQTRQPTNQSNRRMYELRTEKLKMVTGTCMLSKINMSAHTRTHARTHAHTHTRQGSIHECLSDLSTCQTVHGCPSDKYEPFLSQNLPKTAEISCNVEMLNYMPN